MKFGLLMLEFRSLSWWCWLTSVAFLTAGVCGWRLGFLFAIGLTVFQLTRFPILDGSRISFPIQVRLGYLLLLLIALPENMRLLYWIPVSGTWGQVLFGYCAMARTVSLMPWNRKQGFSMALIKQTFMSAPVSGSFLRNGPPAFTGNEPSCMN